MPPSLLTDAVAHHMWATQRLLDVLAELDDQQLATTVPGTYGSILDTIHHLIDSDASYLNVVSDGRYPRLDDGTLDIAALRAEMDRHAERWTELVASDPDLDRMTVRRRPDGSSTRAPVGLRLIQVIHHGTDHRSQICTALTTLGVEPPGIDVWSWARAHDRIEDSPAT